MFTSDLGIDKNWDKLLDNLSHIGANRLKEKEVEKVFYEVENPLVKVLTSMEFEGVRIDESFLNEYSKHEIITFALDHKEEEMMK